MIRATEKDYLLIARELSSDEWINIHPKGRLTIDAVADALNAAGIKGMIVSGHGNSIYIDKKRT